MCIPLSPQKKRYKRLIINHLYLFSVSINPNNRPFFRTYKSKSFFRTPLKISGLSESNLSNFSAFIRQPLPFLYATALGLSNPEFSISCAFVVPQPKYFPNPFTPLIIRSSLLCGAVCGSSICDVCVGFVSYGLCLNA